MSHKIEFDGFSKVVTTSQELAQVAYKHGFMTGFNVARLALLTMKEEGLDEEMCAAGDMALQVLDLSFEKAVQDFCDKDTEQRFILHKIEDVSSLPQ